MQSLSKFNKGIRFFLCVIGIFSKYVWVISLKDKKGITINNAFQIILDRPNSKPNKILVENGSEFYSRWSSNKMKSWLQDNDIGVYSTHNKEKSVVVETFITMLKKKFYKYRTSTSKNLCIDKLDDIVHKYNNTCNGTIKMKPVDVKLSINFEL